MEAPEGLAVQVLETEASRNSVSVFGSLLYMGPLLEKKRSPRVLLRVSSRCPQFDTLQELVSLDENEAPLILGMDVAGCCEVSPFF